VRRLILVLIIIAGISGAAVTFLLKSRQHSGGPSVPVLRVFGYSSFTGSWGPGPKLKANFEEVCGCKIEFVESTDSGYILQRLKLEGADRHADLVIGLDQFDLANAEHEIVWREIPRENIPFDPAVIGLVPPSKLIPFDWGVIAFVARRSEMTSPPTSLDDLLKPALAKKIAIENPGSSSPGQQFLHWVLRVKGEVEGERYLSAFLKQVHSVSPGWTEAYGLFTKKIVATTLSYTTSPVYHQLEENSDDFMAMEFTEGHPVQMEFMGIPDNCQHCEIAQDFVAYLLSAAGQKMIMEKSYMFPIREGVVQSSPAFAGVRKFKTLAITERMSQKELDRDLEIWSRMRRGE
jgi:thiamine transport system substrate-binding protein